MLPYPTQTQQDLRAAWLTYKRPLNCCFRILEGRLPARRSLVAYCQRPGQKGFSLHAWCLSSEF
jgi:hypothetical protein